MGGGGSTRRRAAVAEQIVSSPFELGQEVLRRDGGESSAVGWKRGFVTDLSPLRVTASESDPQARGFTWHEVMSLAAFEVEVVGATGSVTVRGVRPDDPLWTLKEKVAATLGTAPGAQRLVLGSSQVLEPDDAMVANCGLVGDSRLQLTANADSS